MTDLKQVMPFIMRTWMYGSGVLYSAALSSSGCRTRWRRSSLANPLLVYIELARNALLDQTPPLASPDRGCGSYGVGWAVVAGTRRLRLLLAGRAGVRPWLTIRWGRTDPDTPTARVRPSSSTTSTSSTGSTAPAAAGRRARSPALRRIVTRTQSPTIREVHAVKGVSFAAYEGEAIGLIGSNGSGKSTLLRAIAGLLPADAAGSTPHGQPSLLGRERGPACNDLSGERNAMLGCLAMGMSRPRPAARVPEIIDFSGINERASTSLAADADVLVRHGGPAAVLHRRGEEARRAARSTRRSPPATRRSAGAARSGSASCATRPARSSWSATDSQSIRDTCERTIWLESGVIRMDGPTDDVVDRLRGVRQAPLTTYH